MLSPVPRRRRSTEGSVCCDAIAAPTTKANEKKREKRHHTVLRRQVHQRTQKSWRQKKRNLQQTHWRPPKNAAATTRRPYRQHRRHHTQNQRPCTKSGNTRSLGTVHHAEILQHNNQRRHTTRHHHRGVHSRTQWKVRHHRYQNQYRQPQNHQQQLTHTSLHAIPIPNRPLCRDTVADSIAVSYAAMPSQPKWSPMRRHRRSLSPTTISHHFSDSASSLPSTSHQQLSRQATSHTPAA